MADYDSDKSKIQIQFDYNDREHARLESVNTRQHDEIKEKLDELCKAIITQDKDYTAFKNRIAGYGTVGMLFLSAIFGWLFKKLFT